MYRRRLKVPYRAPLTTKDALQGTLSFIGKPEPLIPIPLWFEPILPASKCSLAGCHLERHAIPQLLRWDEIPMRDSIAFVNSEGKEIGSTVIALMAPAVSADLRTLFRAKLKLRATFAKNCRSDLHRDRTFPAWKLNPDIRAHATGRIVRRQAGCSAKSGNLPTECVFGRLASFAVIESQLRPDRRYGDWLRIGWHYFWNLLWQWLPVLLCIEEREIGVDENLVAGHRHFLPSAWRPLSYHAGRTA